MHKCNIVETHVSYSYLSSSEARSNPDKDVVEAMAAAACRVPQPMESDSPTCYNGGSSESVDLNVCCSSTLCHGLPMSDNLPPKDVSSFGSISPLFVDGSDTQVLSKVQCHSKGKQKRTTSITSSSSESPLKLLGERKDMSPSINPIHQDAAVFLRDSMTASLGDQSSKTVQGIQESAACCLVWLSWQLEDQSDEEGRRARDQLCSSSPYKEIKSRERSPTILYHSALKSPLQLAQERVKLLEATCHELQNVSYYNI